MKYRSETFTRIVTLNLRDNEKDIIRCVSGSIGSENRVREMALRNHGNVRIMCKFNMRYDMARDGDWNGGYLSGSKGVYIFDEDNRRWRSQYSTGINDATDWNIIPDFRFLMMFNGPRSMDWQARTFMKLLNFQDESETHAFCSEVMEDMEKYVPRKLEFMPDGRKVVKK